MPHRASPMDWLSLIVLVVLWGASFAMSKHAIAHLDASWVMALRLAVAAAVLVPYALLRPYVSRAPRPDADFAP